MVWASTVSLEFAGRGKMMIAKSRAKSVANCGVWASLFLGSGSKLGAFSTLGIGELEFPMF
jgi:hypothetical protein